MYPYVIYGYILIAGMAWCCAIIVWNKRGTINPLTGSLVWLGFFLGTVAICLALLRLNGLNGIEKDIHRFLSFSSILLLSVLISNYSADFLMLRTTGKSWALWAMLSGAFILPFISDLFGLPPSFNLFGLSVPRFAFASFIALIGTSLISAHTIRLTLRAFGSANQPSHKNRYLYWIFALGIFILGYISVIFNQVATGIGLCLIGYLILVYVVISTNPKDLIHMGAQSLRFAVVSLLTVGAYTAGFLFLEAVLSQLNVAQPVLTALLLAAVFVLVVNPLVTWTAQKINNIVFGQGYSLSSIVRDYSQSIGNVVDLRLLKQLSLSLISKVIDINHGNLYLVDEVKDNGSTFFRLLPIPSGDSSDEAVIEGRLSASNPVVQHFNQLKRPLLQYELDFSSTYKGLLPAEREWLSLQNAEVFVPILTKSGWIGLFVLGAKLSGEKCTSDDLLLLSTLADQTAVALENARLFSNLSVVNRELQLAKVDLEMAYQQLREIDDLKSSFIRVVTHEMRTPLANMAFSLQLLRMYRPQEWSSDQIEHVEQLESNLSVTRMMVDNLISFAAFLNRQVELNLEFLDFKTLTSEAMIPIKKVADAKGVDLRIYFVGDFFPIRADRKLLSDAIYQLIQNAVKFTPQGGKVWVTCWTATDLLYFDVRDTGVGVPRDKLKLLWEGFSQASDPILRGQEGLGLGLALVRFIVAAHGGKVWVESAQGEGSTFGFRIPVAGPEGSIDSTSTVHNNRDITRPLRG